MRGWVVIGGRVVKGGERAMRDSSLPTVGDRQRQWGERGLERGAEGKRRCTEGGMMGLGVGVLKGLLRCVLIRQRVLM